MLSELARLNPEISDIVRTRECWWLVRWRQHIFCLIYGMSPCFLLLNICNTSEDLAVPGRAIGSSVLPVLKIDTFFFTEPFRMFLHHFFWGRGAHQAWQRIFSMAHLSYVEYDKSLSAGTCQTLHGCLSCQPVRATPPCHCMDNGFHSPVGFKVRAFCLP